MLASVTQTFGVILIVVAAVLYLGLLLRKSIRRGGGACCGSRGCGTPLEKDSQRPESGKQLFVSQDLLSAKARQLADRHQTADPSSRS